MTIVEKEVKYTIINGQGKRALSVIVGDDGNVEVDTGINPLTAGEFVRGMQATLAQIRDDFPETPYAPIPAKLSDCCPNYSPIL